MSDYYKIIVSPENVAGDLSVVDYNGTPVGVYSAMTEVVSSGPNGASLLTDLSVPLLFRQTAVDAGYYSPFDGAVLQRSELPLGCVWFRGPHLLGHCGI